MKLSELEFQKQLNNALEAYCGGLLSNLPQEEDLKQALSFSKKFEDKMDVLFRRQKNPPRNLHHSLAKRVAMIALIVTVCATSLLSVEAIRIPMLRFFAEVHETFTRIVYGEEITSAQSHKGIEQIYQPAYIPEGFTLDSEQQDQNMSIMSFSNGVEYFDWNQYCSDAALHVDTEGTYLEEVVLNGTSYLYYENKGLRHLIWEANGYVFTCDGTPQKEVMIEVAKSIKE